jgi:hypothetical protein
MCVSGVTPSVLEARDLLFRENLGGSPCVFLEEMGHDWATSGLTASSCRGGGERRSERRRASLNRLARSPRSNPSDVLSTGRS